MASLDVMEFSKDIQISWRAEGVSTIAMLELKGQIMIVYDHKIDTDETLTGCVCLRELDGELLWVGDDLVGSLKATCHFDEHSFLISVETGLYNYSIESGEIKQIFNYNEHAATIIKVLETRIYLCIETGEIICIDSLNFSIIWSLSLAAGIINDIDINDEHLICLTDSGNYVTINYLTGVIIYNKPFLDSNGNTKRGHSVVPTDGGYITGSEEGTLIKFDDNGIYISEYATRGSFKTAVIHYDGKYYAINREGQFCVFDKALMIDRIMEFETMLNITNIDIFNNLVIFGYTNSLGLGCCVSYNIESKEINNSKLGEFNVSCIMGLKGSGRYVVVGSRDRSEVIVRIM